MSDTEFVEDNQMEDNEDDLNSEDLEEAEERERNYEQYLLLNDPSKYTYLRRVVQRPQTKKNEIYLSNNGKFLYYIKRAKKLLIDEKEKEIIIHGLGAAIPLAVNLSLQLQKDIQDLVLSPTTSSEEIIDQYDPLTDDLEPVLKIRHASAIHIKIINKTEDPIPSESFNKTITFKSNKSKSKINNRIDKKSTTTTTTKTTTTTTDNNK
ncbi:hypothetical protein DICPUDRAFT_77539 [Dictyostelium purpureum]|uniref:Ribonuclease P protein subunit p20 n=1 Tax=Dictyostelium purpureum TaxID=5786 RepID=F0ZGX1_DICPU|nr:uncharacterized protein DICPUDRAFT_77539 [Dictyostelium purpureum]EGC36808.1 hypothetical protein DICPUDRAFT_77539 [Dictyostelium purpureum]|eukprot:XP_003286679.1 hypothetical protein DICPUDRAFT_77539 [Dictyostelium purpureum]